MKYKKNWVNVIYGGGCVLCVGGVKYFQIARMQANLIKASRAQHNSRETGIGNIVAEYPDKYAYL